jgi:hypothetical protein
VGTTPAHRPLRASGPLPLYMVVLHPKGVRLDSDLTWRRQSQVPSKAPSSVALRILELRYAALALAISAHSTLAPKASHIDISHQCSVTSLIPLHAAARRADRPHRKLHKDPGRGIQW